MLPPPGVGVRAASSPANSASDSSFSFRRESCPMAQNTPNTTVRRAGRGFYRRAEELALGAACALAIAACSTTPVTGRTSFNLFSIQQDKDIGAQSYAETLKTAKLRDQGPEFEMVKRVCGNLASIADDPGFEWEVHL